MTKRIPGGEYCVEVRFINAHEEEERQFLYVDGPVSQLVYNELGNEKARLMLEV